MLHRRPRRARGPCDEHVAKSFLLPPPPPPSPSTGIGAEVMASGVDVMAAERRWKGRRTKADRYNRQVNTVHRTVSPTYTPRVLNYGSTNTRSTFTHENPIFKNQIRMPIDFYYTPGSPPCRSVLLTAKALGLELNLKPLDLHHGEHLKPEFVKLNPQHCVPTLVDGDLVLWESRAIIVYLVQAYGKDDSLFPKDPKKQAVVNQRLQFDLGTLFPAFADQYYPYIFAGVPKSDDKEKKIHDALAFLEIFLGSSAWAAGDSITVADLALAASISTFEAVDVDLKKYANISKWFEKAKSSLVGYQEANQKGIDGFKAMVANLTKK